MLPGAKAVLSAFVIACFPACCCRSDPEPWILSMRKLLVLPVVVIVGLAALSAFSSHASENTPPPRAVLTCPKTDVSAEQIIKIQGRCVAKCDNAKTALPPSWISACKTSCDTTYTFCMGKFTEWKKKRDECVKPTKACIDACPHGSGDDFNKCFNSCANKNADSVQDCIKRAMDWPAL
jgi:hypothetical protein